MIESIEEIRLFQRFGVDKILVNSMSVKNEKLLKKAINIFGNQFIVIGLDVKKEKTLTIFIIKTGKRKLILHLQNGLKR